MSAEPKGDLVVRAYSRVLRLYPGGFRQRFEFELLEAFSGRREEARREGRFLGEAVFWAWILRDLCLSVPREYAYVILRRLSGGGGAGGRDRTVAGKMDEIRQDFRFAIRFLLRQPLFAMLALGTLGLGIGAATASFSLVNAIFFRPLPYENGQDLVMVWNLDAEPDTFEVTQADFLDWRRQARNFQELGAMAFSASFLAGEEGAEQVRSANVSENFFRLLGVTPALGTGFRAEHGLPGENRVAVLSHQLWERRFGRDPGVLARTLSVNGRSHAIVGVLPPSFRHPDGGMGTAEVQLWTPIPFDEAEAPRHSHYLRVMGRLKEGVPIQEARAEMSTIARQLEAAYPETNRGEGAVVIPLREQHFGASRSGVLLAFCASALLLVIVCSNLGNLVLAQSQGRRREFAIRRSLGAGGARLARLLIMENVILALGGGLVGWVGVALLADLGTVLQGRFLSPLVDARMDLRVILFSLVCAATVGIFFGLLPLMELRRATPGQILKEEGGSGGAGGRKTQAFRGALVVAQISLAMAFAMSAGLLARSFLKLVSVPAGFETRSALLTGITLPRFRYQDGEAQSAHFNRILEALPQLPGVEAVAMTTDMPFGGGNSYNRFTFDEELRTADGRVPLVEYRMISPDYFKVMGIGLREGREFEPGDRADSPLVAVINQEMAKTYAGLGSPVGQDLIQVISPDRSIRATVVGVAANVQDDGYAGMPEPAVYFPFSQRPGTFMNVVVRTAVSPLAVAPSLREALRGLDPQVPVGSIQTVTDFSARAVSTQRFALGLGGWFAVLSTLLASVGVFGLVRFVVAGRRREFGIRAALGAQGNDLVGLVLRWSLGLTLIGVVLGAALGTATNRILSSLLFGVHPNDPFSLLVAGGILIGVSLAAAFLPARGAMKVEPVETLKHF